jgi:hypothetical protein
MEYYSHVGNSFSEVVFRGKPTTTCCTCLCSISVPFPTVSFVSIWSSGKLPLPRHFQQEGPNYVFARVTNDPVTVSLYVRCFHYYLGTTTAKVSATPLKPAVAESQVRIHALVNRFSDLLQKCLALDPVRRIPLRMQHCLPA